MTISTNRLIPKLADLSRRPYFSNRGFIQLPLMGWVGVGVGVLVLMLSGALWIQSKRLSSEQEGHAQTKAEFSAFVNVAKAMGEAAKEKALKQEAADKKRKEDSDAENKDLRRELDVRRSQLRARTTSTAGSLLPSPAPGSPSPDKATFDRTLLDRALRDYEAEVQELIGEGAEAVIDLDTGKRWATGGG